MGKASQRKRERMPRKKKAQPKFKIGQWVRLSENSKQFDCFDRFQSKGPWQITGMIYNPEYEDEPSPWRAVLTVPPESYPPSFWEEHLMLDTFYNAIHEAVQTKEKEDHDGSPAKSIKRKSNNQGARRRRQSSVPGIGVSHGGV